MMLGRRTALVLAATSFLAGCGARRRRPPPASVHSVVGDPYQTAGGFEYPRAQYAYDRTGLAIVSVRHGPTTADGAPWDDDALLATHPTLQLPAVARVTNLETGREILVRVDDRGPGVAGRLIGMSRCVADLLGPGGEPNVWRVRVQVDPELSRAVAIQAGGMDTVAVAAAPTSGVVIEQLPPPPGIGARPGRVAATATVAPAGDTAAVIVPPRLPERVTIGPPRPGSLYVEAGTFSRPEYATLLVTRLAGQGAALSTSYAAERDAAYRVRIGPLATVAAADAALDRARLAGVMGAGIIVD